MKFGFIAHPTSIPLRRYVKILDLLDKMTRDLENGFDKSIWINRNTVPFIDFGEIRSACGATCKGIIAYMPLTAEDMVRKPKEMHKRVLSAIETLRKQDAELIGLGGFTGIIGNRGEITARKAQIPITTGNSLTAFSGYEIYFKLCEKLEIAPEKQNIVIVGFPGSISLVIGKLLLRKGCRIKFVHRNKEKDKEILRGYLSEEFQDKVELTNNIEECYDTGKFFISASSSGRIIDSEKLTPGSVVIDIALPKDVKKPEKMRNDILLIDGGNVSGDGGVLIGSEIIGFGLKKQINGCLAETIILALEGKKECFSLGRELSDEKVLEIGSLAKKHGFNTWPISSYGEKILTDSFVTIRKYHHPNKYTVNFANIYDLKAEELRKEILNKFNLFVNPVLGEFYHLNKIDRVFVKGRGCKLYDSDGKEYLDMVAGYGCLNLGHNQPDVKKCIKQLLDSETPNFIQYVSLPLYGSLLAEKLCSITPGEMGKVFFSNSGAEAVEAALKLARAASGKTRIIYAENSYHGKTLGALSVTGKKRHQEAFYPLVPDCTQVPFGDLTKLEDELIKGDSAGFIVEPIQGEGGVIVPPNGYLKAAQNLCNRYSVLFIVDEIQTGFGRTGKMFACEHYGVEPDILIVAKSLSGGIMPIGATISKSSVWEDAYGTIGKGFLHTSTFGGCNIAAGAGLAAIDVMDKINILDNVTTLGPYFKQELHKIADRYSFIEEIRGTGLMLGIKFGICFKDSIRTFVGEEMASRLPGNIPLLYRFMSDESREYIEKAVESIEKSLEELFCIRFVTKMAQEHNILTFLTANSSKVLRIQSPLVITKDEVDQFLTALEAVCEDMNTVIE